MVPTTVLTVAVKGSAMSPTHTALVEDAHDAVLHALAASRDDGVMSRTTKLRPITEMLLVITVPATLRPRSRAESTGAAAGGGDVYLGSTKLPSVPRFKTPLFVPPLPPRRLQSTESLCTQGPPTSPICLVLV